MADRKVSELVELTNPAAEDLFLAVDDPNGTPVSKKVTVGTLAQNLPNTSITGTISVTANASFSNTYSTYSFATNLVSTGSYVSVRTASSVISNNATTQFGAPSVDDPHDGKFFWDANYLYVATSNTVIKRVALSDFS